ncbi:MAG: aminomethyl-transferring glycine dehydrogenase [Actinobacteria bacterium]|uniref:glycine dehydrogenase (aminomethyl-transferring) n=1 Tax=freshwater metagenome TaxID=449393 RepID=A0A6J7CRW3_9ZZZZ|nr:aminomethyl-transferring glycine dehydrogenase [Actinomycetota bacterium]
MTYSGEQFSKRHIGPSSSDELEMLQLLGYHDIETFISDVIPGNIHIAKKLSQVLDSAKSEVAVIAELREIASQNQVFTSLIGGGYYGTITPPVIKRNVLENPAWYTAYTPYQPEISQGRLEAIFAFQTVICDMTALALSNASMLDEGTAAAEAMTLARRTSKASDDAVFLIEEHLHPQTKAVVQTRAKPLGIKVIEVDAGHVARDGFDQEFFGLLLQYPDTTGEICDYAEVTEYAHSEGALVIAATDLLALTLIKAPGEWGADIAVGSAQRFGVPMGFGGPHAGFIAVRAGLERSLPGRLVGQSVDSHGNPAFRLALQTREQHIRRDKATSNICTAQVLLANMSAFYAMWHGPVGLRAIAERVHGYASRLHKASTSRNQNIFDTVTIDVADAQAIHKLALSKKINFGRISDTQIRVSFDETTTDDSFNDVLNILSLSDVSADAIALQFARTSNYLTHPVFNTYRSETSMMRYLRTLADRDLALDRTMIPLGSCTMKLNAATEMEAVTWPEFSSLHPFAPTDQSKGLRLLIDQLSQWLIEITGYDAVSLQPNAGSQGEFAGLLAIRNYHDSRGDFSRDICLIPSSAHGTNAASAVMAGMSVVVVNCDEEGNVSLEDLELKIALHGDALAALMVTYPSTHGVFESAISQICSMIHEAGGQVYVDGANLNALVGTAQPGKFGADVSHLNLHKTFCIPHGGGGPGVGPVIAKAHLAPFLPNHPLDPLAGPASGPGPISAAPFGSASILPISWAYIRLMGGEGLTHATEVAILNANYMAARLKASYPILYTGAKGLVAHECILDIREITKLSGVTVDDIAKRLMDYGFHAPTMSFPVAGTLMIEPTESEDILEMNRFIDAMIGIRHEIQEIIDGKQSIDGSPLRNAPHTIGAIAASNWERSYPREAGAFPTTITGLIPGELIGSRGKYWPTVGRIDGAFGDRNLVCSCAPIEAYSS